MVSATLGRVISKLKELDISILVFAMLVGIDRNQVQLAFRGMKYLGSDVELHMSNIATRLAQLLPVLESTPDDSAGVQIDRTDWYSLKRLLNSGVTADEARECRAKLFGPAPATDVFGRPINKVEQDTRA